MSTLAAPVTTNYLERYDAAPESEKYPLVYGWMQTEPLPFFAELRERRPILVTPQATIVTLFDEVTELLDMPTIFTVKLYLPKMGNGIYLMAHDDDALHTREKSLMMGLLNRDDLPQVRAMVADIAKDLLSTAPGSIEAIGGFCRMVPAKLVQEYFGLKGIELSKLIEWSYWAQNDTFYNQPFDLLSPEQSKAVSARHDQTGKELGLYVAGLTAAVELEVKAAAPVNLLLVPWHLLRSLVRKLLGKKPPLTDNIVTRMVRTSFPGAVDFNVERIAVNAGGLLIGSIETTSQASSQVIQYLLDSPDLLAQAIEAAQAPDPRAFDGIVWEALRFVPISPYMFRQCAGGYTLGNGTDHATAIPDGTYVLAATQSAMFDPRAFEQPEQFIPTRNWYHYFTFGYGSHECLGKYVGMVMIPEMVRQILRMPGLHALGPIDYEGGHLPQKYPLAWTT